MNIAFLTPYTPTRIRTRPYHFLKTLAQNGHRLTLYTTWSDRPEQDALQEIQSLGINVVATRLTRARAFWNSLRAAPSATPLQASYSWEPQLARSWNNALQQSNFDVAHVEHLRGARYAQSALQSHSLVWDSVDCISSLFEHTSTKSANLKSRLVSRIEYPRTRAYEAKLIRQLPHTIVVSETERRALLALPAPNAKNPEQQIHVVPNGIDTDYFSKRTELRDQATIVFSGKMSYHANITAAFFLLDEIMPSVWAQLPEVQVVIVGANPPAKLQSRGSSSDGRITVTGTVGDIRPYLERATVAVAPMVYAAGMQNKILEAMAMRTPVITTPNAAAPLGARVGRDLLTAETAPEFSKLILETLHSPGQIASLSQNGRAFVEMHLSWQTSVEKLLHVYALAQMNRTLNPEGW